MSEHTTDHDLLSYEDLADKEMNYIKAPNNYISVRPFTRLDILFNEEMIIIPTREFEKFIIKKPILSD